MNKIYYESVGKFKGEYFFKIHTGVIHEGKEICAIVSGEEERDKRISDTIWVDEEINEVKKKYDQQTKIRN